MKAGIFFTGTGPILILTSHDSLSEKTFVEKLRARGIKKFIAYEVPLEKVKKEYGMHYSVVMGDLRETDDLRVLDYDGHHIFLAFSFADMGEPIRELNHRPDRLSSHRVDPASGGKLKASKVALLTPSFIRGRLWMRPSERRSSNPHRLFG